jgi:hypothetical protein
MKEEAEITCGCKERNFWNCLVRVLESLKGLDETITAILWCGGL